MRGRWTAEERQQFMADPRDPGHDENAKPGDEHAEEHAEPAAH
jgi:hypothetical protein